jgi:hypothetical protein
MRLASLSIACSLIAAGAADADPLSVSAAPASSTYAIGARVGGYGFRRAVDSGDNAWDECRMSGLGVFAQRAVRGPIFVEAGVDTYFSTGPTSPQDLPLDRQNVLATLAIGARSRLTSWLVGYAQLGAGVELARVSVPYGDGTTIRDDKVLPNGFLGIGVDVRIARATYLGMTTRTHVMANFDYDASRLKMANPWIAAPSSRDVFAASPDLSAQVQFYVRRDL